MTNPSELAIMGGKKTIEKSFPGRGHFGVEEKAAVDALFDAAIATGNATGYNGKEEDAYCREFAEFMGGGFADGVNSGTNAVHVALRALDIPPFSEVIVGCVTDPGGVMPIALDNCIPVIADAAPGQYNTGAEQIEPLIGPLTRAIVVPHIGGEPADMTEIMALARGRGIPVVEDCSQSHGAKWNGAYAGSLGDIAAFSTMFGKHHCTGGQGGVVFTKNEALYQNVRRVADRGKPFAAPAGSTNSVAALNCNLSEFAAAIGRAQLRKLPDIIRRRRAFAALLLKKGLKDLKSIRVPQVPAAAEHVYWWWRLEVCHEALSRSKDEFLAAVAAEGVALNPTYRAALPHTFEWFKKRKAFGGADGFPWTCPLYKGKYAAADFPCPNATAVMDRQFNLVFSESWGETEAELIVRAFKKVENAYKK